MVYFQDADHPQWRKTVDFISADKIRKSASACFVDITVELDTEEMNLLIGAHPGSSPLKERLAETHGFHSLSRVGVTNQIVARYDGPAHPLNVTPDMLAESGGEIFAAIQTVASELRGS